MKQTQVRQLHASSDETVILGYYVVQYRDQSTRPYGNCYGIVYRYQHGGVVHSAGYTGPRSGRLVTFSRESDAERLCRVLNGQEEAAC